MISVHPIRGGASAAGYYLQRESGCEHSLPRDVHPTVRARYYLDGRELPARWIGDGAEALRLRGALDEGGRRSFQELLAGRLHEEQLARPVIRYDGEGKALDVRVSAYDVTISAPKSVSTLMATGAPDVAEQIRRAHQIASEEALALLQTLAARAARGHHGDGQRAPRIGTDGFVAAAFDHATSRALDPQLHTHVVVMNLVKGEDGRWSALDSRTLHRQATTASYLYQHVLRAALTEELGIRWEPIERGVAEIVGVPQRVRREFSTRRAQIEAHLGGRRPDATTSALRRHARTLAAKAACLATRPAKSKVGAETLREGWLRRAAEKGLGPDEVAALLNQRHTPAPLDRAAVEARVLGADGATRERPIFDQGTVLRELINALPPGTNLTRQQLLEWTARLLDTDEILIVESAEARTFTTAGMVRAEHHVLALAQRSEGDSLARVDGPAARQALDCGGLRRSQADLAQVLLTSGRPVEVISGPAGSGKTRGLAAATTVWTEHGFEVRGTAVAALTAQGLQNVTGKQAVSLARLLQRPQVHLPEEGVLLVDEAGMIGTRQLDRLLTLAAQRACKVVLVGDPAQLPEMEAGGSFAALTRLPYAVHLDGHGRQTDAWARQALFELRNGHTASALDAYDQHGCLHTAASPEDLRTRLVADYTRARKALPDPGQIVILTSRRRDVTALNQLIRKQLRADGVLGRRALRVDTPEGRRDYRKGDQVLITRNDTALEVLNGSRGVVRTVRRDGLVVHLVDGRRVLLDKRWLAQGDLDHGYAMTLHKAQGRTVHTCLVLGDDTLSQEGGYVGLSRGTHANHLYLDAGSEAAVRDADCGDHAPHAASLRRAGDRPRPLTRSDQQQMALSRVRQEGIPR